MVVVPPAQSSDGSDKEAAGRGTRDVEAGSFSNMPQAQFVFSKMKPTLVIPEAAVEHRSLALGPRTPIGNSAENRGSEIAQQKKPSENSIEKRRAVALEIAQRQKAEEEARRRFAQQQAREQAEEQARQEKLRQKAEEEKRRAAALEIAQRQKAEEEARRRFAQQQAREQAEEQARQEKLRHLQMNVERKRRQVEELRGRTKAAEAGARGLQERFEAQQKEREEEERRLQAEAAQRLTGERELTVERGWLGSGSMQQPLQGSPASPWGGMSGTSGRSRSQQLGARGLFGGKKKQRRAGGGGV